MGTPQAPDPFERVDDGQSYPDKRSFSDKLFKTQPRLVPMALLWLGPLILVAIAVFTQIMLDMRLEDVDEAAARWRLGVMLVAVAPYVLVMLLPVLQRRHLTNPEPFYTYCRRASVAIAFTYPVLWITLWLVGPGNAGGRSAATFVVTLMYGTFAALFPWVARLNHAAWLRLRAQEPLSYT